MRKIPAPRVLPESLPFWQAADEGRYLVKKCNSCGQVHHYPRDICPFCLSADTVWQDSPGTGVVYSFSTMGKDDAAYTMAYVTGSGGHWPEGARGLHAHRGRSRRAHVHTRLKGAP